MPAPTIAFLGGAVGGFELLVILAAVLILFGPKRLPELARQLGRMVHDLQRASQDFKRQVVAMDEPSRPALPPLAPPAADVKPFLPQAPAVQGDGGNVGDPVVDGRIIDVTPSSESHVHSTERRAG
jgi:sec-independent protein translocase protein TatA